MGLSPGPPGPTYAARIAFVVFALAGAVPSAGCGEAVTDEAVKAAYLYKFVPFVTWPDKASSPDSPVTICVAGDETFAKLLDQTVSGVALNGRPVSARRLEGSEKPSGCQVLYLDETRADRAAADLGAVKGRPVLTVTAAEQGGPKGIINFVLRDNHVRFEIDDAAAAENGLLISSKLLSLAVAVELRK